MLAIAFLRNQRNRDRGSLLQWLRRTIEDPVSPDAKPGDPTGAVYTQERVPHWPSMDQGFSLTELAALERTAGTLHARPGAVLFDVGSTDGDEVILIEGELELRSPDGVRQVIRGGEAAACRPLARLKPRQYRAKALTSIRYLRVNSNLMRDTLAGRAPETETAGGYDVVELLHGESDGAQSLFLEFVGAVARDQISLPSLPTVAARVREAIAAREGTRAVSRIINIDSAIAAKVLRSANSPLYRGEQPCTSIGEAVTRVGVENTQKLILTFALREVFETKVAALEARMKALWRHTQAIGCGAFVLARALHRTDAEGALLAGLLHEIGAVALLAHAEGFPEVWRDSATLERVLSELKGEVGSMVLSRWGFEPAMVRLPVGVDDWQRGTSELDHCGLLQLVHFCTSESPDVPAALKSAGLGIDELRTLWAEQASSLTALKGLLGDTR